jgi:protein-arginine kinase activator protein McsA
MTKFLLYPEVNDKDVCEAAGCFERPTINIKLKVSQRQTITLHICNNCIDKFDQNEGMLESVHQRLSNTNQIIQPLSTQESATRK